MKFSRSHSWNLARKHGSLKTAAGIGAVLVAVCTTTAQAVDYTWGNVGTDFNTAADWNPNTGFPGSGGSTGDTATFSVAETMNPNLSASDTITSLTFNVGAYTLSATNSAILTLLSTGTTTPGATALSGTNTTLTNTISAPVTFGAAASTTQTVFQAAGGSTTLSGAVANTNALTALQFGITGTPGGIVNLTGGTANTGLTAPIFVASGTLIASNTTAANGDASLGSGSLSIGSTGVLASSSLSQTTLNRIISAPLGSVVAYASGASGTGVTLDFSNANLANVSLGATSNITITSTSVLTPNSATYRLGGGGATLTVQGGALKGANSLVVSGGPVSIGSSNTSYTGTTTINAGGTLSNTTNTRIPIAATTVNTGGIFSLTNTDPGTTQTVTSLTGGGTVQVIGGNPGFNKILTVNGTASTTFSGVIQDSLALATPTTTQAIQLVKNGTSTLTLSGTNLYAGGTTISGGTLSVSADTQLGAAYTGALSGVYITNTTAGRGTGYTSAPTVTLAGGGGSGASFTAVAGTTVTNVLTTNAGTGYTSNPTVTFSGGGATTQATGTATVRGSITLDGGTLQTTTGFTSARPVMITTNNGTIDTTTTSSTFSGVFSGTGGFTKVSAGTLTLTNTANTYVGATAINGGTLLVNGTNTGAGAVTVGSADGTLTGTLGGTTGTITGAVTVNTGSTITGGAVGTVGMLSLGSLTMNSGSTYSVDVSGAASDKLAISGALLLNSGANITVSGTLDGTDNYTIATFTGGDAGSTIPSTTYSGANNTTYKLSDTNTSGALQLVPVPVPEPSTYLCMLAAAGGMAWMRKRGAC